MQRTQCIQRTWTFVKYWVEWTNSVTDIGITNWAVSWLVVTNITKIGHLAYIFVSCKLPLLDEYPVYLRTGEDYGGYGQLRLAAY
jgi:hypothetical protein